MKRKNTKDAIPPCSAAHGSAATRRRCKQQTAEIPPGLEWCKASALRLISLSATQNFQEDAKWGKWCRSVAGAALAQDPVRLEWLARDAGYAMPPNE